jgi:tripartite-type tricarboxylate transporter receptor subunit TctC
MAQAWPAKPVRVIVTFPPGGTPDIYGRIMAAELSRVWNQNIVVENRVGASGTIGTDYAAKSAPDGYTLLFAADAPITMSPHLYLKLPYDPLRDLVPVVNIAQGAFTLLAHPSFPANNLKEMIALVKSQPGKVSYASSGNGSQQHLSMELVRTLAGLEMIHIPYKGFGQGVVDVLSGQVPMLFGGVTASISYIRSGKLKGLGVTGPKRVAALPELAPFAETFPGFDIQAWYGFMAPAGTPRDIVRKLNEDSAAIVRRPDFQERLAKDGIESAVTSPEEYGARIKRDIETWGKIIRSAGLKPE